MIETTIFLFVFIMILIVISFTVLICILEEADEDTRELYARFRKENETIKTSIEKDKEERK